MHMVLQVADRWRHGVLAGQLRRRLPGRARLRAAVAAAADHARAASGNENKGVHERSLMNVQHSLGSQ